MKRVFHFMLAIAAVLAFQACEEKEDETTDGTGSSVNLNRDLALYYTFDESTGTTVRDYSASNITGIIDETASLVSDTPSGRGNALRLRQNAFVNIPSYPLNDSTNVSVCMWVKDFGQGILIASFGRDNGQATPTVYVTTENKIAYVYHKFYNYEKTMSMTMDSYQASGWHHIAVTASNKLGTVSLYIDGRLTDTFGQKQFACEGTKMQIGGKGTQNTVTDPMTVDNIRVYKRCINPTEVTAIYNAERQ